MKYEIIAVRNRMQRRWDIEIRYPQHSVFYYLYEKPARARLCEEANDNSDKLPDAAWKFLRWLAENESSARKEVLVAGATTKKALTGVRPSTEARSQVPYEQVPGISHTPRLS